MQKSQVKLCFGLPLLLLQVKSGLLGSRLRVSSCFDIFSTDLQAQKTQEENWVKEAEMPPLQEESFAFLPGPQV